MSNLARFRLSPPEWFVLVTLILVGTLFVFAIPLGAGWDEETHLIRTWELASLHFVPNELPRNQLPYPAFYWRESYRRDFLLRPVDPDFNAKFSGAPLNVQSYIYSELPTRSVYSPLLLAPQAFAIRYLGQGRDLPALTVLHASRLLGLIAYAALAWAAVRVTPYGKWSFALIATLPTSLFQAATVSADPVSTGIGLFFIALTLRFSSNDRLDWKELIVMLLAIGLLFNAKANLAVLALLPLVLLKPSRFRSRGQYALLAAGMLILGAVEIGGWAAIAYPHLPNAPEDADPLQQLLFLFAHPLFDLRLVLSDLLANGVAYGRQLVAAYGYDYWYVPLIVFPLYLLGMLAALLADSRRDQPSIRTKRWLLTLFALAIVGTLTSLYLANSPVGNKSIWGVQGRYFAALLPLLLVGMIGQYAPGQRALRARRLVPALGGAAILFYGLGLALSYHVTCGSAYYRLGLCYQPVYKNWAPNASYSAPISGAFSIRQEIVPECGDLTQVRVWVNAQDAATGSGLALSLIDDTSGETLVAQEVSSEELPDGGWLVIDFGIERDADGKAYTLQLMPWSQSELPGTRVAYTIYPEYELGRMFENGVASDVDTVFDYGCLMGLQRLLAPGGSGS